MFKRLRKLLLLKLRFATTGAIAAVVDTVLYLILVNRVFVPLWANIISYSVGILLNFVLHWKYVFDPKRNIYAVFGLSLLVSMGSLALNTAIVYYLQDVELLQGNQTIIKLIATGIVFFYNFFFKRFAFEKRFLPKD